MPAMKETRFDWFRRGSAPTVESADPGSSFEVRLIPNADLTEEDIPREDATWDQWSGISSFAASFDGYALRELTLTELRTSLFCQYRAVCHVGHPTVDDLRRAQAIIAEIRDRVKRWAIE